MIAATDEHNEALRQIGVLAKGESVRGMSFAAVCKRVRRACQERQSFDGGLRRWRGGLSESKLCHVALESGAGAAALLPIAWCLAAYRVAPEGEEGSAVRNVADIGSFFQIGLHSVVMPKLEEFTHAGKGYVDVMVELIGRTVQQHLRVAWQRFAAQGQDVSVLVADLETWARHNEFRAGQTESRLGIAIDWLAQLNLTGEDGLTAEGERVLRRALTTLEAVGAAGR